MPKILKFAEPAFAAVGIFILSGAVILLVLSGGANQEDVGATYNTSLLRLCTMSVFGISSLLIACRWQTSLRAVIKGAFVFSFTILAVVSVIWSSEPDATLRNSVNLIGSSLFGLYLGTRYSIKQLLVILGWVFGFSIILSFLFAILLPKYGLMGGIHAGLWRGVYIHKNGLGVRMVNSIMVFLILMFQNKKYKWISCLGIFLSVVLILFARSTSALVNSGFILVSFIILQAIRWNYRLMVLTLTTLTTIGAIFTIWLVSHAETVVTSLGKDLTLSGRTILWSASWDMIQRKPWLGYGYDGFWHGMNGESAYIWLATGWKMNHPHNGFVGVLLDLGFVGLLLFFLAYVQNFYRSLLILRLSKNATGFYPILSLLFLLASNLTETSLPFDSAFGCVLYVFLTLALTKEIEDIKRMKINLHVSKSENSSRV